MSFVDRDGAGRVSGVYACAQRPGQEEIADASVALAAFEAAKAVRAAEFRATLPEPERLDSLGLPDRLMAAVALTLSASWAGLTLLQKKRVQDMIDKAGVKAVAELGP